MEKKAVNLLQQRRAPPTFWERLYDWVTNTCRIVVIITEILVLGAFGWRFWLDRRLTDLETAIEGKGEILKSLSDQEEEIRTLQAKLTSYKELWTQSSNFTPIIQELNTYIPQETEDLEVSVRETEEGRTLVVSGKVDRDKISDLENSLKDSLSFSDVALSAIERESGLENIYIFTLNANIIFEEEREPLTRSEITESST